MFPRRLLPLAAAVLLLCCVTLARANGLHDAIRMNNLDRATKLLTTYPSLANTPDEYGNTPLHLAAGNQDASDFVVTLLDKGAVVDARQREGATPLMIAVQQGNTDTARLLLSRGATPSLVDNDGDTLLHYAAANGNFELVKLALEKGGDVHAVNEARQTPLQYAFLNTIDEGVHLNPLWSLSRSFNDMLTSFIPYLPEDAQQAFREELSDGENMRQETVALLIERGSDVQGADMRGVTPLLAAACMGDTAQVKLLLEKGADPSVRDETGRTFLHAAARSRDPEMVKLALSKGGDVNAVDDYRNTPLHYALDAVARGGMDIDEAMMGMTSFVTEYLSDLANDYRVEEMKAALPEDREAELDAAIKRLQRDPAAQVVQLLVEQGAKVDVVNVNGDTPLLAAAAHGNIECARVFLEHGAAIDAKNDGGQTVLYLAAASGKLEMVKFFVEKGCSVNGKTVTGSTPLHAAIDGAMETQDTAVITYLISKGADVNAVDAEGNTALHEAIWRGGANIVKALMVKGAKVDIKNGEGKTALDLANASGDPQIKALMPKAKPAAQKPATPKKK